jgi:hypothetical protein
MRMVVLPAKDEAELKSITNPSPITSNQRPPAYSRFRFDRQLTKKEVFDKINMNRTLSNLSS